MLITDPTPEMPTATLTDPTLVTTVKDTDPNKNSLHVSNNS